MMRQAYRTAAAFKQALEQRLQAASESGTDFARRRQLVIFDRLLARVALEFGDAVTLKGGLAVELRLDQARTTKDVDLRMRGSPDVILERLRASLGQELGDFMVFTIRPDARHPEIQNEGIQYEGMRFRAECTLAGKIYGRPFGVDVAFGDPILGEPDLVTAPDTLAFAGVPPPTIRVYPVETHLAEKLHAYTLPRTRPNSRIKDLPDIPLIGRAGPIEASRLRTAFGQTFTFRGTHNLPDNLPPPPPTWEASYAALAHQDKLPWLTLAEAFEAARAFIDPVLAGPLDAQWNPSTWDWK